MVNESDEELPQFSDNYDANDSEQINKARKKAGRAKHDDLEIVKAIMELPTGRAWFYRLLGRCGTFTAPAYNTDHETNRAIGRQMIGHIIQEDIMKTSPENYWIMIKENGGIK